LVAIATLAASPRQAAAQTADTIKVSSFNILHGSSNTRTVDVIRASGADVAVIQESDGRAAALAQSLGWVYRDFSFDRGAESGNTDVAILSRFPITQTLRSGVRVQTGVGKEAYVFGAHLPAFPYQPYDIRDGLLRNESQAINAAKSARGAQMNQLLAEMEPYVAGGKAVFLGGDFNEPSHLDWTAAAATARLHAFKVAWPTSTSVFNAGFADSYRVINPNPVTKVGNTWTPVPGPNEVHDRIDMVYAAGVTTSNAQVVGENATNADIVVTNFPSDHRAVVGTFGAGGASLAPLRKGLNLISNSGAEANPGAAASADRVLTDWEATSTNTRATAQLYNKSGYASGFSGSGWNHFYGGETDSTAAGTYSVRQSIRIADLASDIDADRLQFDASGYFGGWSNQNDTAALIGEFLDGAGGLLGSFTIGDVTAQQRRDRTTMLFRSLSGDVPVLTRDVRLTLRFNKVADGTFSDGSADNLSFVVHTPEPATAGVLVVIAAAAAMRRGRTRRLRLS
jgi:endonuclease/exonuclease/phosphatase family metal-dependent hydrolase